MTIQESPIDVAVNTIFVAHSVVGSVGQALNKPWSDCKALRDAAQRIDDSVSRWVDLAATSTRIPVPDSVVDLKVGLQDVVVTTPFGGGRLETWALAAKVAINTAGQHHGLDTRGRALTAGRELATWAQGAASGYDGARKKLTDLGVWLKRAYSHFEGLVEQAEHLHRLDALAAAQLCGTLKASLPDWAQAADDQYTLYDRHLDQLARATQNIPGSYGPLTPTLAALKDTLMAAPSHVENAAEALSKLARS